MNQRLTGSRRLLKVNQYRRDNSIPTVRIQSAYRIFFFFFERQLSRQLFRQLFPTKLLTKKVKIEDKGGRWRWRWRWRWRYSSGLLSSTGGGEEGERPAPISLLGLLPLPLLPILPQSWRGRGLRTSSGREGLLEKVSFGILGQA